MFLFNLILVLFPVQSDSGKAGNMSLLSLMKRLHIRDVSQSSLSFTRGEAGSWEFSPNCAALILWGCLRSEHHTFTCQPWCGWFYAFLGYRSLLVVFWISHKRNLCMYYCWIGITMGRRREKTSYSTIFLLVYSIDNINSTPNAEGSHWVFEIFSSSRCCLISKFQSPNPMDSTFLLFLKFLPFSLASFLP